MQGILITRNYNFKAALLSVMKLYCYQMEWKKVNVGLAPAPPATLTRRKSVECETEVCRMQFMRSVHANLYSCDKEIAAH